MFLIFPINKKRTLSVLFFYFGFSCFPYDVFTKTKERNKQKEAGWPPFFIATVHVSYHRPGMKSMLIPTGLYPIASIILFIGLRINRSNILS